MKHATYQTAKIFKGVSTLDAIGKNLRIFWLLVLLSLGATGAIYGGHSILDLVDPSFNPDIQTNGFGGKQVLTILTLPDGKMLFGGVFNSYNRQPTGRLVRLNADATLDLTFTSNALSSQSQPTGILMQPDGKIVVKGLTLSFSGQTAPATTLLRLNADGTPDLTFNYTEGNVADMTIDASGRLLVAGSLFSLNRKVLRLNSDGSVDTSFQFVSTRSAERIQAQNNKVLVVLTSGPPTVARINEDGTNDASFTPENLVWSVVKISVQPDGKILLLDRRNLRRLNQNGGADPSFTPVAFDPEARFMSLGSDGKITISQGITQVAQIKRFLADGTPDSSFATYDATNCSTFAAHPDGSVIIGDVFNGGTGTTLNNYFARVLPSGTLDTAFNVGGIGWQMLSPGGIRALGIQTDGKVLIGGRFDIVNNTLRFKIARLNANSTLDTGFEINTSGSGNSFTRISDLYYTTLQPDGKIIVSGNFDYTLGSVTKRNIVRLNTDGSIDSTFNLDVSVSDDFACCGGGRNEPILLSDGKILIGASHRTSTAPAIPIRLNANGTRDTSFNPTLFAAADVAWLYDMLVQPDGKILVGGRRMLPPNAPKSFIARLNADGTTDQTFPIIEESGKEIVSLDLLPNGKILAVSGNAFGLPVQQSSVLRLNSDGSVDNTFNAGTATGKINIILLLPTGKAFIGGNFTAYNGQARQNLAQLNADGSLNSTTYNLNDEVLSLTIDGDGRVLVGGNFTIIETGGGSSNRTYLARLIDSSVAGRTRFDFDGDGRADIAVFAPVSGNWSILRSQSSQPLTTQFGTSGDKTAAADFDKDGKADIAVYRPSEGTWYLMQSTAGFSAVRWGEGGDKPVPADYDGDGKADVTVWRPSNGYWYILQSTNQQMNAVQFGQSGDFPLADADFDGDAKADIAVWRPSSGTFYWLSSATGNQFRTLQFGASGDIPSVGDFNGDGKTDFVVFRPSEGNWYQYLSSPTGNLTFAAIKFGLSGDEPVAADYNGDGKTDIAVRRQGVWHLLLSNQGYSGTTFGDAGAQAIAALPN